MSSNDLIKKTDSLPNSIPLTDGTNLSLLGLTDEQKQVLMMKYAGSMLDLQKKAAENSIDAQGIRTQIDSHIDQSNKARQDGNSATISYTHDSSLGRTEALIGNTERAATGKLSKSATGEKDNTIMIITIIAVAAVLIAIFASG